MMKYDLIPNEKRDEIDRLRNKFNKLFIELVDRLDDDDEILNSLATPGFQVLLNYHILIEIGVLSLFETEIIDTILSKLVDLKS